MGQVIKAYLGLCFLLLMGLVGIGVRSEERRVGKECM